MFEHKTLRCPLCEFETPKRLEEEDHFVCASCNTRFTVMTDEATGKVALVEERAEKLPEPLFLPRGSIRAGVAVAMAFSSWFLIVLDKPVPAYLFSLLLAIIGYYFAFRAKIKAAQSRIFDAAAEREEPLFLPAGVIRALLILGFVVSGAVLCARGKFTHVENLAFFVILFGLILGHVVARVFSHARTSSLYLLMNHIKGAVVIGVAGYLSALFVGGGYAEYSGEKSLVTIILCAVVSFYYGSRT